MNEKLIALYHAAPYGLKCTAASIYGYYLKAWRYGRETDRLVAEARARESWGEDQWKTWRFEKLGALLERAVTQVPYYRNYWKQDGRRPEAWKRLENWPVLDKEILRRQPLSFLADDVRPRKMFHLNTSGTTGTPLSLLVSRDNLKKWYALFEARWRQRYGVDRNSRWAIFGGKMVIPVSAEKPPFWIWNAGMSQLYCSTYHLSSANIPGYLKALRDYRIEYLFGYASSLYLLAAGMLEQGLEKPAGLRLILSNAEPLFDHPRALIEKAFGCPAHSTYGMAEMVMGASECASRRLHVWPESGVHEVLRDDGLIGPSGEGELLATGLINTDMILIRYAAGDRVTLEPESFTCGCGDLLPVLSSVQGRVNDMLLTRDGRKIYWINPVFQDLPVREAQVIQEKTDTIRIRFVPDPGFTNEDETQIARRLKERVGEMNLVMERVAGIPRGKNGKFRAVINRISGPAMPSERNNR